MKVGIKRLRFKESRGAKCEEHKVIKLIRKHKYSIKGSHFRYVQMCEWPSHISVCIGRPFRRNIPQPPTKARNMQIFPGIYKVRSRKRNN